MAALGCYFFATYGVKIWTPVFMMRAFPDMPSSTAVFHAVFWFYVGAFVGVTISGRLSDKMKKERPYIRFEVELAGILLCILLMCCGAMGAHAESEQEYALFAVRNGNYLVQAVALDMRSIITLTAGGHGSVTFDEDNMEIAEWALDGEALSLILADGNAVTGLLSGGILQLDLYGTGEMILCYALPGADTSAFPAMSYDEFMAQYAADQAAPDSRKQPGCCYC